MKILNRIIASVTSVLILMGVFAFTASAEASAIIAFSSSKPTVGQDVTVKVTIKGGEAMYNTTFELSYDASVLKYVSTDAGTVNASGAGLIKASPNPGGAETASYSFTFSTLSVGSSNVSVSGAIYGEVNDLSFGASASLTVVDAAKSDNANLSKLSLSKGSLSPKFSASTTSYTATVTNSVKECRVYATAADGAAKVEISGSNALEVGENTRTVTVTAASGKQQVYTIVITRKVAETSVPEEPTEEIPEVDPYIATVKDAVEGSNHTVATDISAIVLPKGFTASTAEYNGVTVAVAQDAKNNYRIYYLNDSATQTQAPYVISADGTTFEKLRYVTLGANTYIFAEIPAGYEMPKNYYETAIKIGEFQVLAYARSDAKYSEFYYVYCYYDNNYGVYCYDSKEAVLQRSPDVALVEPGAAPIEEEIGFLARFAKLSANAKIIMVGLVLAAVIAVTLIVLLIVKLVKGKNDYYDEEEYDDGLIFHQEFDEVKVTDASDSDSEETEE